ncbi:MAG: glycine dehydrogenase, partial [Pyrinomonadaceae bacterium]|nr:glycine dehydrogenase [Pyrinomonadaceae bacterium]
MRYIPNSPEERAAMLHQIGLRSADDLFASIPEELRLTRALDTPAALSEIELLAGFERMAAN